MAGLLVSTAHAQYFLRGDFNGWGMTPLTDNGNGTFSATVTGGTPGANVEFKIANADWSSAYPGSNVRTVYDASGNLTVNFTPSPAVDGWSPTGARVGYNDPQQFGWDLMGSLNGWTTPIVSLTSLGNGHYGAEFVIPTPGTYYFKFREAGNWNISVGGDFGNSAGDIPFTTTDSFFDVWTELSLDNGSWEIIPVPEPSVLALLATGGTMLLIRRRKQA